MKNHSYSIGEFAKKINVTAQTLRNWDKTGKLKPSHLAPSGHRYYSEAQRLEYLGTEMGVIDQWSRGLDKGMKEAARARKDFMEISIIMSKRMSEEDSNCVLRMIEELNSRNGEDSYE